MNFEHFLGFGLLNVFYLEGNIKITFNIFES